MGWEMGHWSFGSNAVTANFTNLARKLNRDCLRRETFGRDLLNIAMKGRRLAAGVCCLGKARRPLTMGVIQEAFVQLYRKDEQSNLSKPSLRESSVRIFSLRESSRSKC